MDPPIQTMSSCANDETDRQTETVADLQFTPQGFEVVIKEEPEDSGYEKVLDGDIGDDDDSDDNTIYTGEVAGEDDDNDDLPSTAKTVDEESAEARNSAMALVDDDGEPIDVVIKLEPEDENEGPETEINEEGDAKPIEEEDKNPTSTEDEELSERITTTVVPTENTKGLFKGCEIFECEECEKMFSSKHHLEIHQKRHRTSTRTGKVIQTVKIGKDVGTDTKVADKDFECSICGLRLGSLCSLNRHEKEHSRDREFKCRYCEKTFMRDSGRKDHEKRHLGIRNYKCRNCTRTFYSSSELKSHHKTHKGEDYFSCKVCLEGFPTEEERDAHQTVHGGDYPFGCDSCDASFMEIGDLYRHTKQHEGALNFKCSTCDKAFTKRSSLRQHKKIHVGKEDHKCLICNYTSYQKSLVDAHMRVHTGEKPFKCMYCQRAFSGINSCRRHERSHRGEKRYPCKFCGKRFVCCGDRRVHERQHTGEKPFKCRYCGAGFIKSYPRTVHERKHEELLPGHVVGDNASRRHRIVETNHTEPIRTPTQCEVIANDVDQHLLVNVKRETTSPDEDWNATLNLRGYQSSERNDREESDSLDSSIVGQGQAAESGPQTPYTIHSTVSTQHIDSEAKIRSPEDVGQSSIGQEGRERLGSVLGQCPPQMTSYLNRDHHHSNRLVLGQHNSTVSTQHVDSEAKIRSPEDVSQSSIGQEGRERLGSVLGQCPPQMTSYLNRDHHHHSNRLVLGQHNSTVSTQHVDSEAKIRSPEDVGRSSTGQEGRERHGSVLGQCPPQMTSFPNHRHHHSNRLVLGYHNRVGGISPSFVQHVKQEERHNDGPSETELSVWHYGSNDMGPPVCYPLPNDLPPHRQVAPHLNGTGHVYFRPPNHETYMATSTAWQQFQQGSSSSLMGHPPLPPPPPLMGPFPAYNGYF